MQHESTPRLYSETDKSICHSSQSKTPLNILLPFTLGFPKWVSSCRIWGYFILCNFRLVISSHTRFPNLHIPHLLRLEEEEQEEEERGGEGEGEEKEEEE